MAASKARKAQEFDISRLSTLLAPPQQQTGVYSWSLSAIRNARDEQILGKFWYPARMAEAMRTDDALFVAYSNRLAPMQAIGTRLVPASGACGPHTGDSVAAEADPLFGPNGSALSGLVDIVGCLAQHGVAIGVNTLVPREDGSRVDIIMKPWPIEWVRLDSTTGRLMTRVADLPECEAEQARKVLGSRATYEIPICHADGRWVIFQKFANEPWKQDAAILPSALVWARHAFAGRDWAKGSVAHGNAKAVGELAEGVPLVDATGALTVEAAALLAAMQALVSAESPAIIRPAGSKTEYVTNTSTAWQVWERLMDNAGKAAARIWLGTDGTLGSAGGAPGVDITALFGVATTKVQGDLSCITRGLRTGVIDVWAAINYGTSDVAPAREYMIPDADEEAIRESFAKRNNALLVDMKSAKEAGCVVDQPYVDTLAEKHGVPSPRLAVVVNMASTDPNTPAPVSNVADPALPISAIDPDGDGEPGEPATDEAKQALADKMTTEQIPACEHGSKNRCRLCGVERVRDFEKDPDTGEVVWKIMWRPIP
jgi:hypothetical protein